MNGNSPTSKDRQCSAIAGLLSPYIDGEVTPAEKSFVEEHLASCEGCTREMESLRATVGFLQRLPDVEVPRSFTLQPSSGRQPSSFFFLRNATAALAALLIVLFAGSAYLQTMSPRAMSFSAYSPSTTQEAAGLKVEEPKSEVLSSAPELQKAESRKAPASESIARDVAPAPTAAAQAPAGATPGSAAPRAAAPAAPVAPPVGEEPAASTLPKVAEAPPVPGESKGVPEKGVGAQSAAGADATTGLAQPVQPSEVELPQTSKEVSNGDVVPEGAPVPRDAFPLATEPSRWPLREAQIGVGILLVLSVVATLVVWLQRKGL